MSSSLFFVADVIVANYGVRWHLPFGSGILGVEDRFTRHNHQTH